MSGTGKCDVPPTNPPVVRARIAIAKSPDAGWHTHQASAGMRNFC